ncbi:hypothetical protein XPA_010592 [Xanthoria parietina]
MNLATMIGNIGPQVVFNSAEPKVCWRIPMESGHSVDIKCCVSNVATNLPTKRVYNMGSFLPCNSLARIGAMFDAPYGSKLNSWDLVEDDDQKYPWLIDPLPV